jgi:hypothetical protein
MYDLAGGEPGARLSHDPVDEARCEGAPHHRLARVDQLATEGFAQLGEARCALNHFGVERNGVVPDLRQLVHTFQKRTGVEADLVVTGDLAGTPGEAAETLRRVGWRRWRVLHVKKRPAQLCSNCTSTATALR